MMKNDRRKAADMTMNISDHWPLFGLRITTPSLELRTPTDADLAALVELVKDGIHDPATMPFTNEWTDEASPDRERNSLRYWWHCRSSFSATAWDLPFAVVRDGEMLGVQNLLAKDFPSLRVAQTGSWLGRAHHGQGVGKEMRRAVLHFAFTALGAHAVTSEAYQDNDASNGVSLAVGYELNGVGFQVRRGERSPQNHYLITRQRWEDTAGDFDVTITGFDECRAMFGL